MRIEDKWGIQPEIRNHFSPVTGLGQDAVPLGAPVNAVTASITDISAAIIALLGAGDTVSVDGAEANAVFTFNAVPGAGEFSSAVELAALINAMPDWVSVENAGAVEAEAVTGGVIYNGLDVEIDHFVGTTAGGGAGTTGDVTIAAATLATLYAGCQVSFDGNIFTRVAAAPGAGEFTNTAELAALINALADWGAVVNVADIDISSSANGAEWNGFDVKIMFPYVTAGGVNGTPGVQGAIAINGGRIYVSTATLGFNNDSWVRCPDLNFVTY